MSLSPEEIQAARALVEAERPHEDWCCAKGCAGPAFCTGCENVCRCVAAEIEPYRTLVPRLLDALDEARAENASCGAEWVRTTEAEATVVEARRAALLDAADALPLGCAHEACRMKLRARADAQGPTP